MSASTTTSATEIVLVRKAFQAKYTKHTWLVVFSTVIIFAAAWLLVLIPTIPDGVDLMGKLAKFVYKDPWE